jgi:hypothetical protein
MRSSSVSAGRSGLTVISSVWLLDQETQARQVKQCECQG